MNFEELAPLLIAVVMLSIGYVVGKYAQHRLKAQALIIMTTCVAIGIFLNMMIQSFSPYLLLITATLVYGLILRLRSAVVTKYFSEGS